LGISNYLQQPASASSPSARTTMMSDVRASISGNRPLPKWEKLVAQPGRGLAAAQAVGSRSWRSRSWRVKLQANGLFNADQRLPNASIRSISSSRLCSRSPGPFVSPDRLAGPRLYEHPVDVGQLLVAISDTHELKFETHRHAGDP